MLAHRCLRYAADQLAGSEGTPPWARAHLLLMVEHIQAAKGRALGKVAAADNIHRPQLEGDGRGVRPRAVEQALVVQHV